MGNAGIGTMVPALAFSFGASESESNDPVGGGLHAEVDGSLLSADISGFTRLTETLAERGREGAEIVTEVVNSCFTGLIGAAEQFGGDVIKFGGDAILVLFVGASHRRRAAIAAQQMQFALARNTQARRFELQMTVGVNSGPFDVMIIGTTQRDVLVAGPNTSRTLELEAAAEKGEVVVSASIADSIRAEAGDRQGGLVLMEDGLYATPPERPDDEQALARFVPRALRSYYGEYAELGAQHRQVAIGFVTIDGVDAHLATHGGPATAEALSDLFDAVVERTEQAGVTLLHSDMAMGGVKLVLGAGVPSASGDHADALVHAALAVRQIDTPFDVRQGLQVGTVLAGFLGAGHRRNFTVMGDTVNTAARMCGQAEPGEIIAVDDVRRRTRGQVIGEQLEPFTVKGKADPINAMRVTGIGAADERDDVRVALVGRDAELDELQRAVKQGVSTSVVGPAGSGKTRLGEEALADDGLLVAAGGRYATATPYAAFWSTLRGCLGIDTNLDARGAGEVLASRLRRLAPAVADRASLLAPALGAELEESAEVAEIAPEFRRDALHRALVDVLAALDERVVAILVEDAQWLDDASGELADHLEAVGPAHGWVVIRATREPVDEEAQASETAAAQLILGGLDPQALEQIIVEACPRRLLRHELDALVQRSEGNPLFAIELASAAARPGSDLPDSIEELIAARIDSLPAAQRSSVRLASIFGARFELAHFQAVAGPSGFDLELELDRIDDIFKVEDGTVFFLQLLYRDAAYGSLPFARRKTLHRVVGEYLEANATDLDAISTLLSQHFALAGDRRRCWTHSIRAAERAQRQHSPADAEVLYRRALDSAPQGLDKNERSAACEGLADALLSTGSLAEAHQLYGKARSSATDAAEKQRLLGRQGVCRERQGRYSDALRVFSRMINDTAAVPAAQAVAYNGRASVLYHLGRAGEALASSQQALEIAQEVGLANEQAQALKLMHITAEATGVADSGRYAEQALDIVRSQSDYSAEAEILNNIGVSEQLAGQLDPAAVAYRQSLELKQRVGDRAGAAMIQMNLSEVELDRGVTAGVDELLRDCMAEFDAAGFTIGTTYSQGLLGRHAMLTGNAVDAAALLATAAASFEELGADGHAADMELALIEAKLALGLLDDARSLLDRNRELLTNGAVFDNPEAAAARIDMLEQQLASVGG